MRSAKSDKKANLNILKYAVDPNTGEVFTDDEEKTKILLKDYEGNYVLPAYPASIGCDVHELFIEISVMVRQGTSVKEYHFQCETDRNSLLNAKKFAIRIIELFSDPHIDVDSDRLRYCCESTGNWHIPLLKNWGGCPIVINPSLAKVGNRKSDRIDAMGLSRICLLGLWKESYVVPDGINTLRTFFQQRKHYERWATQTSNSINSELLRYGVNLAREGSVTKNKEVRDHVMDQLSDHPTMEPGCYVDNIPAEVKELLRYKYVLWDEFKGKSLELSEKIRQKIETMKWKCGDGELEGSELISLLMTVPGVGKHTAMMWLAIIIDANRFETYQKCVAYCGYDPSNGTSAGKVVSDKKRKGNKEIHMLISRCATNLLNKQSDPWGKWAGRIYGKSGKWKKAANALGRKITIALYYVHKTGNAFDYDMYRTEEPDVMDIPFEQLVEIEPAFRRYIRKLIPLGIETTQEMVHKYHICAFKKVSGLGKGFYNLVDRFIQEQDYYRNRHYEIYGEENMLYGEEDREDFNE
jgi:transposase